MDVEGGATEFPDIQVFELEQLQCGAGGKAGHHSGTHRTGRATSVGTSVRQMDVHG